MAPNRFPQAFDTPTAAHFQGQLGGAANVWQAADASLTRPNNTTAYAAHNAMGSATAVLFKWSNFFRCKQSSGLLSGARLIASVASIATTNMGAIRLHLFNASPSAISPGAGVFDQSTLQTLFADEAAKLGWVDFSTWAIGGTGSDTIESIGIPAVAPMPLIGAAGDDALYGVLEATGAFTPAASQKMLPYLSAVLD